MLHKKCPYCRKLLAPNRFGTRLVKGIEKAFSLCQVCRPKFAENHRKYRLTEKGKAASKRAATSEKGAARVKRAGKQRVKVMNKRRAADPAYAKMLDISCTASKLVSGQYKSSSAFVDRTEFDTVADFLSHMKRSAQAIGMDVPAYGKDDGWVIEHAIPKEAYDFSNDNDIKRCWSKANVRATGPKENKVKGCTIIDELCHKVGADHYPTAWDGRVPTAAEKESFYAACKASWTGDRDVV